MSNFTEEQIKRYSRHIILPEVGGKGQKKIMETKVLIIGAGGLGSPIGPVSCCCRNRQDRDY